MARILEWKFLGFGFFTMYSSIGSRAMRMPSSFALVKLIFLKKAVRSCLVQLFLHYEIFHQ